MRLIDADTLHEVISAWPEPVMYKEWVQSAIASAPTITQPNEWISVEDRLPELPDRKWCEVMVITAQKGDNKSRVMIYERAVVRGKQVERWKYHWDRIADITPDFWMPLPEPPESRPTEGEENT